MGKRNKVVKLTDKKVRYIIRAKRRDESTNDIAAEMKISPSTVKRVWMYWIKTKMPLSIQKFGRKRKTLDAESERLILEVHKEQNMGARRLEAIIEYQHGKHIPHNSIHKVLLDHGLAKVNRNKSKCRNPGSDTSASTASVWCILTGIPANSMARRCVQFSTTARGASYRAASSTRRRLRTAYCSFKKPWTASVG